MKYQIFKDNQLVEIDKDRFFQQKDYDERMFGKSVMCGVFGEMVMTIIPIECVRFGVNTNFNYPLSLSDTAIDQQAIADFKRNQMINDMSNISKF